MKRRADYWAKLKQLRAAIPPQVTLNEAKALMRELNPDELDTAIKGNLNVVNELLSKEQAAGSKENAGMSVAQAAAHQLADQIVDASISQDDEVVMILAIMKVGKLRVAEEAFRKASKRLRGLL